MKALSYTCLVAAALISGHLRVTAAETARFRYLASVSFDDKGGGFNLPEGVACGGNGQVVIGDTGNDRLIRLTYRDRTVSGGSAVKIPELSSPSRIQLNSKGDIYAFDGKQRRIVHLSPEGEFKEVVKVEGAPPPGTIVTKGFAIDPSDNLYVLDTFSGRVLVLDAQGKFRKALAIPNDTGFGADLAVDSAGTLFLLDSIKRRVFSAGKDATSMVQVGKDLTQAVPTLPTYLTVSKGILFILEGSGSSIVTVSRDGSFLARQLAMGWDERSLNHPSQMCINDKDEAFVADRDNSRIQVFQLVR